MKKLLSRRPPPPATPAQAVADYTVLRFDAQQLWDLCAAAVPEQYTDAEESYPGLTRLYLRGSRLWAKCGHAG